MQSSKEIFCKFSKILGRPAPTRPAINLHTPIFSAYGNEPNVIIFVFKAEITFKLSLKNKGISRTRKIKLSSNERKAFTIPAVRAQTATTQNILKESEPTTALSPISSYRMIHKEKVWRTRYKKAFSLNFKYSLKLNNSATWEIKTPITPTACSGAELPKAMNVAPMVRNIGYSKYEMQLSINKCFRIQRCATKLQNEQKIHWHLY